MPIKGGTGGISMGGPQLLTWKGSNAPLPATFFDDFHRANAANLGPNWSPVLSTWGIVSNKASMSGVDPSIAMLANIGVDNALVEIEFDFQDGAIFGVWFRGDPATHNGYFAEVSQDSAGDVFALFLRFRDGFEQDLGDYSGSGGQILSLQLQFEGPNFSLALNGQQVLSASDRQFDGQRGVGLVGEETGSTVNSFRLLEIPGP